MLFFDDVRYLLSALWCSVRRRDFGHLRAAWWVVTRR